MSLEKNAKADRGSLQPLGEKGRLRQSRYARARCVLTEVHASKDTPFETVCTMWWFIYSPSKCSIMRRQKVALPRSGKVVFELLRKERGVFCFYRLVIHVVTR